MKEAIIFGAGAVGRGFIGQVLSQAGYALCFVDADPELVAQMNRSGGYRHQTVGSAGVEELQIEPARAILASDLPEISAAFTRADIAATSVGLTALPSVCRTIGQALQQRIEEGMEPLDLLIAENVGDSANLVRKLILEDNPDLTEDQLAANLGLIATSIGRMIPAAPPQKNTESLAAVQVEPYDYLPLDHRAALAGLPGTEKFVVDPNVPFEYYLNRKLFVHNMGHAMCAYLGQLLGDQYIWQAIGRVDVRLFVRNAMVESASAVAQKYDQPLGPLLHHIDDLLFRFSNRGLADSVARVGRDPWRKLAEGDRFLGAASLCSTLRVPVANVTLGIAAALRCAEADSDADRERAKSVIGRVKELLTPREAALFDSQYEALSGGFDTQQQLDLLYGNYDPPGVP